MTPSEKPKAHDKMHEKYFPGFMRHIFTYCQSNGIPSALAMELCDLFMAYMLSIHDDKQERIIMLRKTIQLWEDRVEQEHNDNFAFDPKQTEQ